jgi:hypothetical protein
LRKLSNLLRILRLLTPWNIFWIIFRPHSPCSTWIGILCGYFLCGDLRREITTAVEKSKHEFWCTRLFITVKSEPLINNRTAQIKRTAPAELFHLRGWYGSAPHGVDDYFVSSFLMFSSSLSPTQIANCKEETSSLLSNGGFQMMQSTNHRKFQKAKVPLLTGIPTFFFVNSLTETFLFVNCIQSLFNLSKKSNHWCIRVVRENNWKFEQRPSLSLTVITPVDGLTGEEFVGEIQKIN